MTVILYLKLHHTIKSINFTSFEKFFVFAEFWELMAGDAD